MRDSERLTSATAMQTENATTAHLEQFLAQFEDRQRLALLLDRLRRR